MAVPFLGGALVRDDLAAIEQRACDPMIFAQHAGQLEQVQRIAHIAVGTLSDEPQRILICLQPAAEAALIIQRMPERLQDILFAQCLQGKEMATGADGRIDAVERIGGRRADHRDVPVFHMRQQQILLVLVQPVDLIDDDDQTGVQTRFRK